MYMKHAKHHKKKKTHISAFTLIEIIIVVGILTLLTTTSLIGYRHQMQKSRDARRKIDIEHIYTALQEYRKKNGEYPEKLKDLVPSISPYLEELPQDPKQGESGYEYTYKKNGNTFKLSTLLENGDYYIIDPYGSKTVASNPQNITPTIPTPFASNTPLPNGPGTTYTKTYTYYADMYLKSWPTGDGHYQYSNLVLNNVTNSSTAVKIWLNDYDNGSNLITDETYFEYTIAAKSQHNSFEIPEEFYGLAEIATAAGTFEDNGKIKHHSINSETGNKETFGWVKIESNKPLAGYNRIFFTDGPDLDDEIIDFNDEPLRTEGYKKTYYPLFVNNIETSDGKYKQFTDINILNPNNTYSTKVQIRIRNSSGSEIGDISASLPPLSVWNSWGNPAWLNLPQQQGTIEIVSDTTDIFASVRQRIVDPTTNPSNPYYADSLIWEDEAAISYQHASKDLYTPLYMKKLDFDETNKWQWTDIILQNTESGIASITINIYKNGLGKTPYHTITQTIPSHGLWTSENSLLWEPYDSEEDPDGTGIPNMTDVDLEGSWGLGWIEITSNKKLMALNKTTVRTAPTSPAIPSNTDDLVFIDNELFIPSTKKTKKLYETHYLNKWPGGIGTENAILKQFTNPVLINPNDTTATVTLTMYRTDTGESIHTMNISIDPYNWWNANIQEQYYNAPYTWPSDAPEATSAWTEITSNQPLFGMHRVHFNNDPDKNSEIHTMDDEIDTLYYACIDNTDCSQNKVCDEGICK